MVEGFYDIYHCLASERNESRQRWEHLLKHRYWGLAADESEWGDILKTHVRMSQVKSDQIKSVLFI